MTHRKYEKGIMQFNNFYDLEGKIILFNSAHKGFYENKETDHYPFSSCLEVAGWGCWCNDE